MLICLTTKIVWNLYQHLHSRWDSGKTFCQYYDENMKDVEIMADCENFGNEVDEAAENHLLLAKNVMKPELQLKLRVGR